MIKKISVFVLLLSLVFALGVPEQVEATEKKYYNDFSDYLVQTGLNFSSFECKEGASYIHFFLEHSNNSLDLKAGHYIAEILDDSFTNYFFSTLYMNNSKTINYYFLGYSLEIDYSSFTWSVSSSATRSTIVNKSYYDTDIYIYYSDKTVYSNYEYSGILFESNKAMPVLPSVPAFLVKDADNIIVGRCSVMDKDRAFKPFIIIGNGVPVLRTSDRALVFLDSDGNLCSDLKIYNVDDSGNWFLFSSSASAYCANDLTGYDLEYAPTITYTNQNIYLQDDSSESLTASSTVWKSAEDFVGLLDVLYTFENWCTDAGLTCAASSNESDSVIPFWYEPYNYNYIVRKTLTASSTSGVYQLTMLQKTDGAHYPYYFEVNDIGYLGVAGAFSDISTFTVRNFYYDAEGNGWKLIERFDVSTLPFDNTNVTFDENVVFIYSDTYIYADQEASSIWQAASTEYYNVDIPEPEAPTPTPTTVPSSGAGRPGSGTRPDIGGEATGGGGLDFIINLFTLIWQKICSIPMAVDGYSISLQQIFVYGALVSIVGGFIIKFIFRR